MLLAGYFYSKSLSAIVSLLSCLNLGGLSSLSHCQFRIHIFSLTRRISEMLSKLPLEIVVEIFKVSNVFCSESDASKCEYDIVGGYERIEEPL